MTLQRIADYFGRYFSDSTARHRKVFRFSGVSKAVCSLRVTDKNGALDVRSFLLL
jgi:hypothetical protein